MMTESRQVEVFIDGSLVYSTREPGESFAAEPVCTAATAAEHFRAIQTMPQEVFAVMSLNGANKPIKTRWVTVGLLDSDQVHPRGTLVSKQPREWRFRRWLPVYDYYQTSHGLVIPADLVVS